MDKTRDRTHPRLSELQVASLDLWITVDFRLSLTVSRHLACLGRYSPIGIQAD